MADWPETAETIAEDLRGTGQSLPEVCEKHGMEGAEDDTDFCQQIDQLVFCCEQCDWWCEISEMADHPDNDLVCDDCYKGSDEDE